MAVSVLRLGHRIYRDQRITTHVFLTARALGVKEGFYTGQRDTSMEESIGHICKDFGGSFKITYLENWKSFLQKWKSGGGRIAHLTVYGLPFKKTPKRRDRLMVVVGGEKVPPEIYQMADWNVAVGSQPHSEVAALGLFLYEQNGRKLPEKFVKARLRVVPQERGKKVLEKAP
ncbi:MAG: tRNA (cytidine(56)-2'-O)-methyltransferase [Candidatus Aenigmatarchaeota archaeon]